MIIQTKLEVVTKVGQHFCFSDPLGNPLMDVCSGTLFESLSREELLLEFFETQNAIEKTQVDTTRNMLLTNRSKLEQQIRATYKHL